MLNVSPWNLLFTVLNLLILLVLMKIFLYIPVLGIIAKRQELIDGQFAQAKSSQEEAARLKQQYEAYLSDTKEEQEKMIREAKVQAGVEYDRILSEASKKAAQMIDEAKKISLMEKEKAVREADEAIAGLAMAAASRFVYQASDEKSDARIYEEFLKKAGEENESDSREICGNV